MKKIVSLFLMFAMSMTMWATKTLYFVPNSNWTQANAKFAVYYFGGTGETADGWSEFMTAVENETNLYTTTIPDGYPTVIFCRMNPAQADRNWDNKWNQTANITLPTDGKNLFTLADGWDQINGTWSTYGAVEPQPIDTTITPVDTTVVPQPVEEHYYLVGAFNNWNTTEAIEFQNADSMYTLSIAALEGEFKVIDAQDWNHGIYGFYTNDYQMPLGSEYNLLAGNQSENIQLNGAYTNVVLNLTKANDVLTLHFVAGTLVEDTTAQPVEEHYYLVGAFNSWNAEEAIEFANADSMYTLSIAALEGEFKVIDAQDWNHGIYGFYTNDYQMPLGSEYNLLAGNQSENIQLNGAYTNVVLNLTKANDVLTLHFVAGTLVEDTTAQPVDTTVVTPKFYITGNAALVGQDLEWNPAAIPSMTESYTLNLLADIDYVLKVTLNGTWVGENNVKGYNELTSVTPGLQNISNDHNIGFKLAADGEVTVIYNDSTFEVLGNFVTDVTPQLPTVAIAGAMNSWSATANVMTAAADGLSASVSMTLNADDYEFKVVVDGSWLAKDAEYQITRQNPSVTNVDQAIGMGPNLKLIADVAGDYTFTWIYATNTVVVTFPDGGPIVEIPQFYVTGNAALVGEDLEWNPAAIPSMSDTLTLNLRANIDYVLKVTVNGTWEGENNVKGYNELSVVTPGLQDISNDHNIGFKLAADGPVNVIYNGTIFKVEGNFVVPTPVEMVEIRLVPGVWNIDGAKMAAVTWKIGETMEENGVFSAWMTGTNTLSTMIPADADSIAFGRFNPESGETPNMMYLWNHTDKLLIDSSMIYTISGWAEQGEDCDRGYWGYVDPSALEVISVENDATVKVFENGVLYIYREGVKYNAAGQIVR